jgi:hypothetical protein
MYAVIAAALSVPTGQGTRARKEDDLSQSSGKFQYLVYSK